MPVKPPFSLIEDRRRAMVGGEPTVLHCNHYNAFLQQSILDADYIDSRPFLVGAAATVARAQLREWFESAGITDVEERRARASFIYKWAGFGTVDLSDLTAQGGTISAPVSHYSSAVKARFGETDEMRDPFTAGWLAGAAEAIFDVPANSLCTEQVACIGAGAHASTFELKPGGANYADLSAVGVGTLGEQHHAPEQTLGVDYEGIYSALTGMEIAGDDDGLIPAFGVHLTRHYANYYNLISFQFLRAMSASFGEDGYEIASELLVEAGHVCAFNTFGGIMTSPAWDALIKPQLANKEAWVSGMTAAVNALGWGRWEVSNVSERSATFRIYDDYESTGYLALHGESDWPVSFLAQGAAMGIMNLVYRGAVETKPEFTPAFYAHLFDGTGSYDGQTTLCRAEGANFTEIVVRAA